MTEIRSILERFGRLSGIGNAAGSRTDLDENSLSESAADGDQRGSEKPARSPAWLAIEILFVTVLVFFWL